MQPPKLAQTLQPMHKTVLVLYRKSSTCIQGQPARQMVPTLRVWGECGNTNSTITEQSSTLQDILHALHLRQNIYGKHARRHHAPMRP